MSMPNSHKARKLFLHEKTRLRAGTTERFTADLSNPAATTSNITTGQSGNPASPYYLDQLPHWLAGTTLPLPLHDAHVSHTLILQP